MWDRKNLKKKRKGITEKRILESGCGVTGIDDMQWRRDCCEFGETFWTRREGETDSFH